MKHPIKNFVLAGLTFAAILGGRLQGYSQTTLSVDTNKTWIGYMNVYDLPGNGVVYRFGSSWGTADLDAYRSGTNVILTPNTSIARDVALTDTYWWFGQGTGFTNGNKFMDANYYVQDDSLAGQTLTFNGLCVSNTLNNGSDPNFTINNGYTVTVFIKDFSPTYTLNNYAYATLTTGQPFSIQASTSPGDHIQYGFEYVGTNVNTHAINVTNLGVVMIAQQNSDPAAPPIASQTAIETQNVTFTCNPSGTAPFTNHWFYVTPSATNYIAGSRFSGTNSGSLTISNVMLSDAGTYMFVVSNKYGSASSSATLGVMALAAAKTNLLIDPSFENDNSTWAASPALGWVSFNGAAFQNSSNVYYNTSTLINVLDGTNTVQIYPLGTYDGTYQDRPAVPGQTYSASGHFYTSSLDKISGSSVCFMELIFQDAAGNRLRDYQSSQISSSSPADTWITLQPTSAVDYENGNGLIPGSYLYQVAPPNTATVRAQATLYAPLFEAGSVYVDLFDLKLELVVTAAITGNNMNLSFATLAGATYKVYWKAELTDASWNLLTTVTGDGTVKTVQDPTSTTSQAHRFYIVQLQ